MSLSVAIRRAFLGLVMAFLTFPLVVIFISSFGTQELMQFPPARFGLRWYRVYLEDGAWLAATGRSLRVGFVSSLTAVAIGTLASVVLARRRFFGRTLLVGMVTGPAVVPHVIPAIGLFILAAGTGYLGREAFLMLAHATLALPFVILIVTDAVRQIDPSLERAARVFGAGPVRAFMLATLPLLLPSVGASWIFAFFISFDELAVALFVMSGNETLPLRIWQDLHFELNPVVTVVSTILIVATTLALLTAERLRRLKPGTGRRSTPGTA